MKQISVFIFSIFLSTSLLAQISEECQTIKLGTKEEIKASEPCIAQLADYVLAQPMKGSDDAASKARATILTWMEKTPDYTFSINENIMKICKGDNVLFFGVYMTALAKAGLIKKEEFNEYALKLMVEYINNPNNKVTKTKEVEKLLAAWEKKEYDKYIR